MEKNESEIFDKVMKGDIRMSQILSTVEPCVFDGLRQLQGGLISNNKINYISYKEKNTTTASGNDPIKRETYAKTGN